MDIFDILVMASLLIFFALFLGRSVLLYKRGIKVWVIGTGAKNPLAVLLEIILFPTLLLWAALILISALGLPLPGMLFRYVLTITWLKYAGTALCYIGLIIFLSALISFGKAWRIGIDDKNAHELVTTGIFRYSRNPIFLFLDMYFIGVTLIYPNSVCIALTIATVTGIHLQILREEQFLSGKFGAEYRAYRNRTRRYF